LPYKANAAEGDIIAKEADVIFNKEHVYVEEKIDGAGSAIVVVDDHPVIRNRSHILKKGFLKNTPAKKQFRPIWNWYYENRKKFAKLEKIAGPLSVYGEWMLAQHGLEYDILPDWFVPYDLFDYNAGMYLDTAKAREFLNFAGFSTVPLLHVGPVRDYAQLEELTLQESPFTTKGQREGVYIKVSDGEYITHRFKMVREGFVQGGLWSETEFKKNKLA
jgi:hypothetical protein